MLKDDVKNHVADTCSLYAGNGRCHLDRPCPFFRGAANESLPRCLYYEQSVLPADDKLKARYWGTFGLTYWGEETKVCNRCENTFDPGEQKRRQYCDECRETQRKEQRNRRMRE